MILYRIEQLNKRIKTKDMTPIAKDYFKNINWDMLLNKCDDIEGELGKRAELYATQMLDQLKAKHKEDVIIAHMESTAKTLENLDEYIPTSLSMQASIMFVTTWLTK